MTAAPRRMLLIALALALIAVPPADGKQVRVNVLNFDFSPAIQSVNVGDHVVFVWTGGGHSTTSGNPTTGAPDGVFNSGQGVGLRFSWKVSGVPRAQTYFCIPHAPTMAGTLNITAAAVSISDFRITEVYFGAPSDLDFVVIRNIGLAAGNLGQYRVSVAAGAPLLFSLVDIVVPPGGTYTLRFNQSGAASQTEAYFPGVALARAGSVALYAPNTVDLDLASVDQIVDFVEWGSTGHVNETTAVAANLWAAGTFVPAVADGHSMVFCGTVADHNAASWRGSETPGTPNCMTPTVSTSWGRIKALYR